MEKSLSHLISKSFIVQIISNEPMKLSGYLYPFSYQITDCCIRMVFIADGSVPQSGFQVKVTQGKIFAN